MAINTEDIRFKIELLMAAVRAKGIQLPDNFGEECTPDMILESLEEIIQIHRKRNSNKKSTTRLNLDFFQ